MDRTKPSATGISEPLSTKERIDAAALALFAEKGTGATTMPDIAKKGGVAVGSLYRSYASKEDLIHSLYARNWRHLADLLETAAAGQATAPDQIRAVIREVCRLFDEKWDVTKFLLMEQHAHLARVAGGKSPVDAIERIIEAGIRQGAFREMDPAIATALVIGPIVQAATLKLYGRLSGKLADFSTTLSNGCLAALTGEILQQGSDQ